MSEYLKHFPNEFVGAYEVGCCKAVHRQLRS